MKMPNAENAVVDIAKIRDYCLNPVHLRGRHKARVFASALGLTWDDAQTLQQALQEAAYSDKAESAAQDEYGQRYAIDFTMSGPTGSAQIRSLWIVRTGEGIPRFVTCYVL